jgi:uncharacterized protein GlcG (DUF336 family)
MTQGAARAVLVGVLSLISLFALPGGCGGGGGGGGSRGGGGGPGIPATQTCSGDCSQTALSEAQVKTILAQAVAEAQGLGLAATVAVLDRVGNVLAVFRMTGAPAGILITSRRATMPMLLDGADLAAVGVPDSEALAAISKAGTGAYLSTQGNAFSTRTANHIVQEHFSPGEGDQPGGPLFGVQFSQLPCGDLVKRFGVNALDGPKRMPLGFSADPGGLPLYVNGVAVGGVGVEADGIYSLDLDIMDTDTALEERIAAAAARGFQAPDDRRADRIGVVGRLLRYADDERFTQRPLLDFDTQVRGVAGDLVDVAGFYAAAGGVSRGALFQSPESGIVATVFEGIPAEILTDPGGMNRFPPTASALPGGLTADEVRVVLREALAVAQRARAQIRRPPGSIAKVTIHVVDTTGAVLGAVRGRDAPVFGIDVSLQKARTAAFFSQTTAGADLVAAGLGSYVDDTRDFLNDGAALASGIAFANRSVGNLARPFYPDGIDGNRNGPFSKPFASWSPFSTGLQLDLVLGGILAFLTGGNPLTCSDPALSELANGIQIFPGSVPIYRAGVLVGAVGVSGDGVDQDDMIAFLGLHNAGVALGGALGNAPRPIRADTIQARGVNLRYVSCPFAPFLDSEDQNVCEGK